MAPTGPDPNFLPLAPEGTYPADTNGMLKKMQELWVEGTGMVEAAPQRTELGKELYRIVAEEKYSVGLVSFAGSWLGLMIKRNNFRNVPKVHCPARAGYYAELYYFEDGKDNMHNPGNKSKLYKSESFLTGLSF